MTTIGDVHKAYKKTLHIENTHLIDVPLATYIDKDSEGDRLFLIGKGSSGCGKTILTEPLRNLSFNPLVVTSDKEKANRKYHVHFISRLTPAVFARGNAQDFLKDLGYHLQNKASFLIYSDLAPLMSMNEETKRELYGMFRDLFDGFIKYDTGSFPKHYKNIKVNSMGFATDMIESQLDFAQMMGTREIIYELPEIRDTDKAMRKRDTPEGREARSNVLKDFLDDIGKVENNSWIYDDTIKIPESEASQQHLKCIEFFAKDACIDRTPAQVDEHGLLIKHIKTEFPMRLNNQLSRLYSALLALGVKPVSAFQHIRQIANTCGNSIRKEIIDRLWKEEFIEGEYKEEVEYDSEGRELDVVPKVTYPEVKKIPLSKNSNQLGYELNIAPREILKHLMILRDMGKVEIIVDKKTDDWSKNIFLETTQWMWKKS